jgi:uncharacterized membrane protein
VVAVAPVVPAPAERRRTGFAYELVLFGAALLAAAVGFAFYSASTTAFHEIHAVLWFVIATVLFAAAMICDRIRLAAP